MSASIHQSLIFLSRKCHSASFSKFKVDNIIEILLYSYMGMGRQLCKMDNGRPVQKMSSLVNELILLLF